MSGITYEVLARFAQQFGILYFAVIFIVGIAYALRPRHSDQFRHLSQLPLDQDEGEDV
ncbi:cbb3-type cytochrome c oxidase subunit 3 [uncultured Brevundimonas sp.]|uniref:cbb3-type cytochrome c oxidase subunit 3 n=1 Tax=uncultured Brevundimonas sp. TaxID=213418 RepID=UPI0030ED3BD7|tara:strand:+ start:96802 stop:96975 length:174 start_codon:yes stop_codon:yes gene_type:complete